MTCGVVIHTRSDRTWRQHVSERYPLPLGAMNGLRYFIVALPGPSK